MTTEQLDELLQAIPDRHATEKKIIALAALTGLRQGELLSLEPTNVHGGRILLRPDQTKYIRGMNGKLRDMLQPASVHMSLADTRQEISDLSTLQPFETIQLAGLSAIRGVCPAVA